MKIPKSQRSLFEVTNDFLFAMARLEYALKITGFLKSDGEADWVQFAQSVSSSFDAPSEKLQVAATYLLENPPQKLKLREGQLTWEEARPPIAMAVPELVLLYLRRLRGNCFHGGKGIGEPAHQKELLKHGIRVVSELLKVVPPIKEAFYS